MRPTPLQRFLAKDLPIFRVYLGMALAIALTYGLAVYPARSGFVAAVLGGANIGAVGAYILLHFLFRWRSWANGAPFAVGDRVTILTGPHADKTLTVYELWNERGQVLVDLGPEAKEQVKDVFSELEVCRADDLAPSSPPKPAAGRD